MSTAGPFLQQGELERCPDGFLVSPNLKISPGQPVPEISHPQSEVFPDVEREPPVFQFAPVACPLKRG